jgi:hypothetical protein
VLVFAVTGFITPRHSLRREATQRTRLLTQRRKASAESDA